MLTYDLKKAPGLPLYESLYRSIRDDILSGKLCCNQKLPSKRALSDHLEVSKITVEGAYAQLLAEGLIRSVEKVGYFVEPVAIHSGVTPRPAPPAPTCNLIDLTGGAPAGFPFSVWSRLQREVMGQLGTALLQPVSNQGLWELRQAIADHLQQQRGMEVDPDCMIIGAGTDFLYNLLIQLLGSNMRYGLEDPGYDKIHNIYKAAGATTIAVPMDHDGVIPGALGNIQALHLCASHHFPSGIITPLGRRQELLQWAYAAPDRWIIEDDYDSEFRFNARPMRAMQALDTQERVIYMNTFSKSLAPSIRIGYMILPQPLMVQFRKKLNFYSCTVSSFDQHTLARFMTQGYFESHLNRMRKSCRATRNRTLEVIRNLPFAHRLSILEEHAGLHFIVKIADAPEDDILMARCKEAGLSVRTLSSYYQSAIPENARGCLVVNYAGLTDQTLTQLSQRLSALGEHL